MFQHRPGRRAIRILAVGGLLIASGAVAAISAPTSASAAPLCAGITEHASQSWSGIVDDCHDYYTATGTATATCAAGQAGSVVSYWAGLGGVNGAPLIQTVLEDLVYSKDGSHNFTVWAEAEPTKKKLDITPAGGIHCGDHIKLSVTQYNLAYDDHDQTYWVGDLTTQKFNYIYVHRSAAWPGTDGSSAEFIVERPTIGASTCPYLPLTKPSFWPIPYGLQTSYIDAAGTPHSDVTMMSVPYFRDVMVSCASDHHVLQDPYISPQYDDMYMRWYAAS